MAKKFSELRAKMNSEARAVAEQQTYIALQEEASKETREDFGRLSWFVPTGKPNAGDEIA